MSDSSTLAHAEPASDVESYLARLARTCPHVFRDRGRNSLVETAHCLICHSFFGWRCANSPDHVCHFDVKNGKVRLVTGKEVDAPSGTSGCVYCGLHKDRQ